MMSTIAASNGSARASSSPSAPDDASADVVALARQQRLEDLAHDLFVVDDEDRAVVVACGHDVSVRLRRRAAPARAGASGSASVNRVPWPTALSQWIVPSCSRTMP